MIRPIVGLMLAVLTLCLDTLAYADWQGTVVTDKAKYRSVTVRFDEVDLSSFSQIDFVLHTSNEAPFLHSRLRTLDPSEFESVPISTAPFDSCVADGITAPIDEQGTLVIQRNTSVLECTLSGLFPDRVYGLEVRGRDSVGNVRTVAHIDHLSTSSADIIPEPTGSRPIIFALGSILLSALTLTGYAHYRDRPKLQHQARYAHFYILPTILGLALLVIYPILYGIFLSFTDADQRHLGENQLIGISNYMALFAAPGVSRVLGFTLLWVFGNVVFHISLGLLLAMVLSRRHTTYTRVYRSILLLPWAIPAYISVLAWNGMLQVDGLINALLGTHYDFLANATSARISVIAVNIWLGVPFMMIMLTSSLQSIPKDMYSAAEVDGVAPFRQFLYLTLPAIKTTILPLTLLDVIWSFNMFNTIYLLTRGSPFIAFGEPGATDILVTYIFDVAFEAGHYGVAAAWSVTIFIGLIIFSFIYAKQTRLIEKGKL